MTSENCELPTVSVLEGFSMRVNNTSSAECLENASFDAHKSPTKKVFQSHIPRSSLAVSNSCNNGLKSDLRRHKGRPSMIPKSKSVKRIEKDNVKIEMSVKSEEVSTSGKSIKNQLTNNRETETDESKKNLLKIPKEVNPPQNTEQHPKRENEVRFMSSATGSYLKEDDFKHLEKNASSTSVKCSDSATDFKEEEGLKNSVHSATSVKSQMSEYKDAEDDLNDCSIDRDIFEEESLIEEKSSFGLESQEGRIQNLYETFKSMGPMFDNFKLVREKCKKENPSKEGQNFSVQKCYDMTLGEISDIWKNTMTLISSVKEHATKYVEEEEANPLDKEQLILEGEMVQLAVDFSINYSKLKTNSLLKSLSECLGVENLPKTDLEEFMDLKTFTALYSDDDLATMSRTLKDLNASVLRGEI